MAYKFKSIQDIPDLCSKRVIVRLDFNVPIDAGKVRDDYRIRKSMKTIDFLRHAGAKVIIISHVENEPQTLKPVFDHIRVHYPDMHIVFCENILEEGRQCIENLKDGGVALSENIRLYDGEKKNSADFAKQLAALGDMYVNDAFSVSHRKHASIVGVPAYLPHYAGFQFIEEVEHISKSFNPSHPFLFILGGAKFDTKLPLINKFLPIADGIFVGGALAHNFYKENNEEVGVSLVSPGFYDTKKLIETEKINLPEDFVVLTGTETSVVERTHVKPDQKIVDAGPKTMRLLEKFVNASKFILWNGTLGEYEQGYTEPTTKLASLIAKRTREDAEVCSIVGGGDTLAAIAALGVEEHFSFVSTGGGAMLDLLANETLPGIVALEAKVGKTSTEE